MTDNIQTTDRTAKFKRAQRHSSLVNILRYALPLTAMMALIMIISGLIIFSQFENEYTIENISLRDGKLTMTSPSLKGFSSTDKPYQVHANEAIQDLKNPNILQLNNIAAWIKLNEDMRITLSSDQARFHTKKDQLKFPNPVIIKSTQGHSVHLQNGEVFINTGDIVSDKTVKIRMPGVELTSSRFEANGKEMTFLFSGNVKFIYDAKKASSQNLNIN